MSQTLYYPPSNNTLDLIPKLYKVIYYTSYTVFNILISYTFVFFANLM